MPRIAERPSASPMNVAVPPPARTISPLINESGHESAVTLHRAVFIDRRWCTIGRLATWQRVTKSSAPGGMLPRRCG